MLGGNQWQSVAIKAPSHLRAIDAHTREISLDEIGRVARARPTAVWQAIEIVRDEMMAAHRERPVAREQQRAREAGFVTERHPTALELVTGLLRAHVPAQGAIRRNQGTIRAQSGRNQRAIRRNQRAIRRTQTQSSAQSSGRGSGVALSPRGIGGKGGEGTLEIYSGFARNQSTSSKTRYLLELGSTAAIGTLESFGQASTPLKALEQEWVQYVRLRLPRVVVFAIAHPAHAILRPRVPRQPKRCEKPSSHEHP